MPRFLIQVERDTHDRQCGGFIVISHTMHAAEAAVSRIVEEEGSDAITAMVDFHYTADDKLRGRVEELVRAHFPAEADRISVCVSSRPDGPGWYADEGGEQGAWEVTDIIELS